MSQTRPLVTIAVPTWNRAKSLERTIGSVLEQLNDGNEILVELLISDNASDDETSDVVTRATARAPRVVASYRNEHNVGGIQNALLTLGRSHGEFWMFYGDDDIVPQGALARIVQAISAHPEVTVFVFGDPLADGYFSSIDGPTPLTLEQAAEELFYYIGNAGRFAIRRDLAAAAFDARGSDFFRTAWPQTELAFLSAAQADEPSFLAVPLASSESIGHQENTLYTTYYLLRTAVVDLDRAAQDIAADVGDHFCAAALRHIFGRARMREMVRGSALLVAFSSSAADRRDARALLREALRTAHSASIRWYALLLAVLSTPPWLMRLALTAAFSLKAGIPTARERVRQLADDARRSKQEVAQGSKRSYGPGEL